MYPRSRSASSLQKGTPAAASAPHSAASPSSPVSTAAPCSVSALARLTCSLQQDPALDGQPETLHRIAPLARTPPAVTPCTAWFQHASCLSLSLAGRSLTGIVAHRVHGGRLQPVGRHAAGDVGLQPRQQLGGDAELPAGRRRAAPQQRRLLQHVRRPLQAVATESQVWRGRTVETTGRVSVPTVLQSFNAHSTLHLAACGPLCFRVSI